MLRLFIPWREGKECKLLRAPLANKKLVCLPRYPRGPQKSGCNSLRCPVVIPLKAFHLLVSDSGNQQLPAAAHPLGRCSCFDGTLGAPLTFPNEGH
ncbi:hypothetical protein TNIN_172851 [Trichonephila inaurata madagascariensis]|uniref:Uncharacterized protein n=1 Tax=Trichonephila inaurata madagascariensis TaxID=2747483 RepID=A0A8X7CA83_9ARAC|nr:hypothetical protein TNIN_172851 [Trichonephila inaurata madagascariensis]